MVHIENVKVYDLKESVIACRNAMRITPPEYTDEEFEKEFIKKKAKALLVPYFSLGIPMVVFTVLLKIYYKALI